MTAILAIDPGPKQSAYVMLLDGVKVLGHGKIPNENMLRDLKEIDFRYSPTLVIEQIASMGMSVGEDVFETVFWSGRFVEAFSGGKWDRVKRHEVKMHLCHHPRAKDANIRQSIIDRYGGKEKAIGRKAAPGPLYGVSGDCWSALAVAITWSETKEKALATA